VTIYNQVFKVGLTNIEVKTVNSKKVGCLCLQPMCGLKKRVKKILSGLSIKID